MFGPLWFNFLRQQLDNLVQRFHRTKYGRIPESPRIAKLLHILKRQYQAVKVLQLGGFKIGDEVQIVQSAGVIEFPLDRLQVRQRGGGMLLHQIGRAHV